MMKYSAGLVSRHYWYMETKKTAKLMVAGMSKDEIKELVIKENIYQAPSEQGAIHMFGPIYRRLESLDDYLQDKLANADIHTSKVLALLGIMMTDRLFFEFMNEVYREKMLFADLVLKDSDVNMFFSHKQNQSDKIAVWTEATLKRLKNCYTRLLYESGLVENSSGDRKITPINIDFDTMNYLIEHGFEAYVIALTGEK